MAFTKKERETLQKILRLVKECLKEDKKQERN